MIKRAIVLLIGAALILGAAPSAMADHCWRCRFIPGDPNPCVSALGSFNSREFCDDSTGGCILSGNQCAPHGFAPEPEPLAAEYLVASVERLDEPQRAANETLVADLETTQPTKR